MPKGDRLKLKADPEDGTTPIANLLLEAVAMAKISGLQKGAILFLWRKTYGWIEDGKRLKESKISLSEWARALDSSSSRLSKTLSELQEKHIIKRRTADAWGGYFYSLNTNIRSWNSNSINISKLCVVVGIDKIATVDQNAIVDQTCNSGDLDNSCPKNNATVDQNATQQLTKRTYPTLYKETLNKYKEIYIVVFNHWNTKNIILHKTITPEIETKLKKVLSIYSEEEIKKAIDNYAAVTGDGNKYFFTYKWTLKDFLQRGLERFLDNASPLTNFLKDKEDKNKDSTNAKHQYKYIN